MCLCAGFSSVQRALLSSDFGEKPISHLCVEVGSGSNASMQKCCFRDAADLDSIVDDFSLLSSDLPNDLFLEYWTKEKQKQGSGTLSFAQVVCDVWQPAIEKCALLLNRLKERSISLQEVDLLLKRYRNRLSVLKTQLRNLQKGICKVLNIPIPSGSWIPACVNRMEQYHSLQTHADAARTFVFFRDSLGLDGDFSVVENLSIKVVDIYDMPVCKYFTSQLGYFYCSLQHQFKIRL